MGFTCAPHSSVQRWTPCCGPERSFFKPGIFSSAPKTYVLELSFHERQDVVERNVNTQSVFFLAVNFGGQKP